jgi:hypothetical protein
MYQESSALSKCGIKCQVVPRLKPGGRKTLKYGLKAQGTSLLFHQLKTIFYQIEDLIFKEQYYLLFQQGRRGGHPPAPPVLIFFLIFFPYTRHFKL